MQAESVIEESGKAGKNLRDPFAAPDVSGNLRRSSVRGASLMSFSRIMGMGLRFLSTGILARLISRDDFGLFAMTAVITGFLSIFMDVGLSQATIQRPEINHRQISTLFWINVGLGVFITAVFAASAPLVAAFYHQPALVGMIPVLSLSFLFGSLGLQHLALLTRNMRYPLLAGIEIFSMAAGVITAVWMARAGFGYWALVGMAVAPAVAKSTAAWIALRWTPGLPSRRTGVRGMLKFGGDILGFNIVNYFSRQTDTILVAKFCGAAPVAAYEKAYSLLLMPVGQINGPLGAVTIPALSRLQEDPERYRRYFLNAILLVCSLSMPVIAGITLFADQVVLVWLGRDWASSAELFRLLAIAALIGGISNPAGWVLISLGMTKRYRLLGLANSAVIVAAFVIGLLVGPKEPGQFGSMRGVAIGYSTAMLLNFVPYWAWALKRTPVDLRSVLSTMVTPALACVPASAAAIGLLSMAGGRIDAWLPVISAMVVFGLVYAGVLLIGFKKLDFFRKIAGELRPR
ncbi:lipopolysaccharide biosynthesis protein [Luteolibacter marinus]|uniref:lipopolysaccharide biosynthesis protein n=1 Tax=Luteolibacter marinus TaxID=2776705 RepID=UPI001867991C|nr:lipopolysaccharide biosynthesis protein [Luteolibacter marinus]